MEGCWLSGRMQWASEMRRIVGGKVRGFGSKVGNNGEETLWSEEEPTARVVVDWCGVNVDL